MDLKFALPGKERQDSVFSGLQVSRSGCLFSVRCSSLKIFLCNPRLKFKCLLSWTECTCSFFSIEFHLQYCSCILLKLMKTLSLLNASWASLGYSSRLCTMEGLILNILFSLIAFSLRLSSFSYLDNDAHGNSDRGWCFIGSGGWFKFWTCLHPWFCKAFSNISWYRKGIGISELFLVPFCFCRTVFSNQTLYVVLQLPIHEEQLIFFHTSWHKTWLLKTLSSDVDFNFQILRNIWRSKDFTFVDLWYCRRFWKMGGWLAQRYLVFPQKLQLKRYAFWTIQLIRFILW